MFEKITFLNENKNDLKYRYENIKDSKDINEFLKYMKKVFNTKGDMNKDDIAKSMKMIKLDDKVIGYIGFSRYNIDGKKYLGIGNFMILPQEQRSGHGTNIINDLIERNKSKYDEIYCYVSKDNDKAVNFYKKSFSVGKYLSEVGQYYVTLYKK